MNTDTSQDGQDIEQAKRSYNVSREALNVFKLNQAYGTPVTPAKRKLALSTLKDKLRCDFKRDCTASKISSACKLIPEGYNWRKFLCDIIAGLTVSSLHVPQGMAYGLLAGVKPVNGLYTSFFSPLFYVLLGTSRHISIGTFSVVSLLAAEPVDRLAARFVPDNNSNLSATDQIDAFRLQVSVTVTIVAGLLQILLALLQLGFLMVYVSRPLLGGFTTAAAIHVFAAQLNGMFGIKLRRYVGPGKLILTTINFFEIVHGTNYVTLIMSLTSIAVLLIFKYLINPPMQKRFHFPFPAELFVLIINTLVSYLLNLNGAYNVTISGKLPSGVPTPMVPTLSIIPDILLETSIVSFVSLATTVSIVKLFATRFGYKVGYTREMTAVGMANVCGGVLQCHCCSGGLARTTVALAAGQSSQIATIVSCSVLLLVLTCIGHLLETLPLCTLSAIISVALLHIFMQFRDLPGLYRKSYMDLSIWLVAFFATVLIDIPLGLLTGLAFSILLILYRTHKSAVTELGNIPGTDVYVDMRRYTEANRIPGTLILKCFGTLFYANVETFQKKVYELCGVDPAMVTVKTDKEKPNKPGKFNTWLTRFRRHPAKLNEHVEMKARPDDETAPSVAVPLDTIRLIIIDASAWSFIDSTGATRLLQLRQNYRKVDISVVFASCDAHVRYELLRSGEIRAEELDEICYPTIHDAVLCAQPNTIPKLEGTSSLPTYI